MSQGTHGDTCPQDINGHYNECFPSTGGRYPTPGCYTQVECAVGTGDFRVVLADSMDEANKVKSHGFGSLDDPLTTGGW